MLGQFKAEVKTYRTINFDKEESREEFLLITQTKQEIVKEENIYLEYLIKRSSSSCLSDSQQTQKWSLVLFCNSLRVFFEKLDTSKLLTLLKNQAASDNIISKRDRKYFTFAKIHTHLIMLQELNRRGFTIKDESTLACQVAILEVCKGNSLGLQVLGGCVISMARSPSNWIFEVLANIFQLLLEKVQNLSLVSFDFFLGAEKLLQFLDKQSNQYQTIKKAVQSKSGRLKQKKGMLLILEDLFISEDRHHAKGMTRRVVRGLITMQKNKGSEWKVMVDLLETILELLSGKNPGIWKPKNKNKKGGKQKGKKEFVLTSTLKKFLYKIIAEMCVELLVFEPSKRKQEALFDLLEKPETSTTLRKAMNTIFRTEVARGEKKTKIILDTMKKNADESKSFRDYLEKMNILLDESEAGMQKLYSAGFGDIFGLVVKTGARVGGQG